MRFGMRSLVCVGALAAAVVLAVAGPASATFPGRDGPLVFSGVDAASHTVQVYSLSPGGGALTRLTAPVGVVYNECPAWSADGHQVFFDSLDRSTTNPAHIFRIDASGGARTLVDSPSAPTHLCPTVSRSGAEIAAIEYANDGSEGIVRMQADGSDPEVVALAASNQDNYSPHFAPTGTRILFNQVTFKDNAIERADLVTINPAGKAKVLTRRSNDQYITPSWSPDGETILAVRGAAEDEIVRMSAGGSNLHVIAKVPDGARASSPTFSPDGSKIAYTQCPVSVDCGDPELPGKGSVWVMHADGSHVQRILDGTTAAVSPDGSSLDWGVSTP